LRGGKLRRRGCESRYLSRLPLQEITVDEAMWEAGFHKRIQSDRIQ